MHGLRFGERHQIYFHYPKSAWLLFLSHSSSYSASSAVIRVGVYCIFRGVFWLLLLILSFMELELWWRKREGEILVPNRWYIPYCSLSTGWVSQEWIICINSIHFKIKRKRREMWNGSFVALDYLHTLMIWICNGTGPLIRRFNIWEREAKEFL